MRGSGNIGLIIADVVVLAVLLWAGHWRGGRWAKSLVLLWCLPPLLMLSADLSFEWRKRSVLGADAAQIRNLGQHFIVGYSSFDEVVRLAEAGLIAGVYVTKHNIEGRTADALKSEIAVLQERRRKAGLLPLLIAADQEGGIVAHLSPPLTKLPALASLTELPSGARRRKAEEFGRVHGQELAELGINLNFAPVLDLMPLDAGRSRFDFNTLIAQRAISSDPAMVGEVAEAYIRGLEASGVEATVKHFPGLGRVRSDTHHFSAELGTPPEQLEGSDWRPFREVLAKTSASLMVGHVTLTAVDPDRPASHSKRVIDGILRQQWNYQGIVLTDDLVMGAIYKYDVCTAVVEALNAGVDLLLVAFDGRQFYRIFGCALDASVQGRLDQAALRASEARLKHRSITD